MIALPHVGQNYYFFLLDQYSVMVVKFGLRT